MRIVDCEAFARQLLDLRQQLATPEFEWYPYDSLGSYLLVLKLLDHFGRDIAPLLAKGPILDLCCADGDLSFFLESEGCVVDAVDWPLTNHNYLRGFQALHKALGSRVRLLKADLDARFQLPDRYYTAAFFLGGLYHLKNPFYVLEALSNRAYYCLLSTRIARWTPDRSAELKHHPVAYLVDANEFADDDSNFWVFSETGLRRLLHRAGWNVVEWTTFGNAEDSDPLQPQCDERAFCLLRSRRLSSGARVLLGEGWHGAEEQAWRWTQRRFRIDILDLPAEARLEFRGLVPAGSAPLTLAVKTAEQSLPPLTIDAAVDFLYSAPLPSGTQSLTFEADRAIAPDHSDRRERALIVRAADLQRLIVTGSAPAVE